MKKLRLLLAAQIILSALIARTAVCAPIINLSTGIDGSGNLIPFGSADDTWLLSDAPSGVSLGGAIVVGPARSNFFELEPSARWVSGSEVLASSDAPWGFYTYQMSFDTSGHTNLSIDGLFGSDNRLTDVRINGTLAIEGPNKYGPCGSTGCIEFTAPISFLINDPGLFVTGVNTIEFIIENQGPTDSNPTSFILNASVYGTAIPIPAAIWLFGSGILGLAAVARRRKTKPSHKDPSQDNNTHRLQGQQHKETGNQSNISKH